MDWDMDHKSVAEKINGLDQLPEYYTPNLELKWGIIEAGMERSRKPMWVWWLSAASVIFIAGLIWLVKPSAQMADLPAPLVKENQASVTLKANPIQEKSVHTEKRVNKQKQVAQTVPLTAVAEISREQEEVTQQPAVTTDTLLQVAQTERIITKQRYVELDFSDGIEQSSPQTTIVAQQFRFKLGNWPAFSKTGSGIKQTDIPVRIQKTF